MNTHATTTSDIDVVVHLSGPFTEVSDTARAISSTIEGEGADYIQAVFRWIQENMRHEGSPEIRDDVFRKRTAHEIIETRFATGCVDYALLFVMLARAKGLHTTYLETVRKESDGPDGHVFVECVCGEDTLVVDPARGARTSRKTIVQQYDIIAEGLDCADCGTLTMDDIREKVAAYRKANPRPPEPEQASSADAE